MVHEEATIEPNCCTIFIITVVIPLILGGARSAAITNPKGEIIAPAPINALSSYIINI